MNDNKHISPAGHDGSKRAPLSEDRLLAYLEGRLPAEEQREVELWLADEGMESDAVDGLQELSAGERKQSIGKLNAGLRKKTGRKKNKRRAAKNDLNVIVALLLILLLAAAAYLLIRYSI